MIKYFWDTAVEEGARRPIQLAPNLIDSDEDVGPAEMAEWTAERWGSNYDSGNYIIVRGGEWKEYQTTPIHNPASGGNSTVESMAHHILTDFSGWNRLKNWWAATCMEIKNLGYHVDAVLLDIEAPKMVWNEVYSPPGGTEIHMHEVIRHIYTNEQNLVQRMGLPDIDLGTLDQSEDYYYQLANMHEYQNMRLWTDWCLIRMSYKMDSVFGKVARQVWGEDTICSNFQFSRSDYAPIVLRRNPHVSNPVGKWSSPVLYDMSTYYASQAEMMSTIACASGPKDQIIPWILSPRHEGNEGYYVTQASHDSLVTALEAWGIERVIVW